MTDANVKKTVNPGEILDTDDPGDDVQARFRYQHTYTAIQCFRLLEENGPSAIYCENYEDVLIEEDDGSFTGIQVKTRQFAESHFTSNDKTFKKSIARFARLEAKFPDQFSKYVFFTNHGFRSEKKNEHLNPQYLINIISNPDALRTLAATDPIKKTLDAICEEYKLEEDKVISAISKMEIHGSECGLKHLDPELTKIVQKKYNLDLKPSKLAEKIAEALISKIYNASSNKISEINLDLYDPQKNFSDVRNDLALRGKKFRAKDVKEIIAGTTEQFSVEHIKLLLNAGEIPKPNYKAITDYIPRKVYASAEYKKASSYFFKKHEKKDLVELLKEKNRIVLLGDAGMGKSIELERLSAHFSVGNSKFYPCLSFLNKFVDQNIEDFLPAGWESVPESGLLIFLDGLDEIEGKNKNNAIRKIEFFSERYPNCSMVISCRRNFYKTTTSKFSGTIAKFDVYTLLDLDFKSIEGYVKQKIGIKSESFFNEIMESNISDLIRIPFYLSALLELYAANNFLPKNKSILFEQLINLKIGLDENHYRTAIDFELEKDKIFGTLEYVALGMEVLGRNYIYKDELRKLVKNSALRELIKYSSILKKTDENPIKWQFEHNQFQEYLAAKLLSCHTLDMVKRFTTFPPEHSKINPSWTNTISFLINLSSGDEVLKWILEIEPEIAIIAEPDKVDVSNRNKIFTDIFNDYKTKKIWIDKDKFPYDELANFAKTDENIRFLFEEAEQAKHYTAFSNAIDMLGRMKLTGEDKQLLKTILINAALTKLDIEIPPHIQERALALLAKNNLNSPDVINTVLPALKDSDNDWVRYGLYYFINTSDVLDEHIDIFLDGIWYIRFRFINDSSSRRSRLMNESLELKNGIINVSSPEAILKIFHYFLNNARDLNELLYDDSEDYELLAENASIAFQKNTGVFDGSVKLFHCLLQNDQKNGALSFSHFFDRTGTRLKAFETILGYDGFHKEEMLAILADQSCLEYLINQYDENNIKDDVIRSMLHFLEWHNDALKKVFETELHRRYGDKFSLKPGRDLEKDEQARIQRDFDLLFESRQKVIDEVKLIFDKENLEVFSKKDTYHLRVNNWPDIYYSDIAVELLRSFAGDDTVGFDDMVGHIEKFDWEWFCISKIYEMLNQENKKIRVSESQKEWINDWCISRLREVDFKNAITKTGKNSISIRWDAIYLWFFFREFHFDYPESILLDMISFDYHRSGVEYLEPFIDRDKMTERILANLQDGIVIDSVYVNHLNYCKAHKIDGCMPYASAEILNTNRDKDDDVRRAALNTLKTFVDGLKELETILPKILDDFKWYVIDALVKENIDSVWHFLKDLFQSGEEEERLKAAEYLIQHQDMEALVYFIEYLKTDKQHNRYIVHRSPLKLLKTADALPYLLDLLEYCYQEGTTESDDFDRLDRAVLDAIQKIALQSEKNFLEVKTSLEEFIQRNAPVYEGINWLNSYLAGIEQQFYINKSEDITIDDVVQLLSFLTTSKKITIGPLP